MANKGKLVEVIADNNLIPKLEAERYVDVVLSTIQCLIRKEGLVELRGFGTFGIRTRNARKGRNFKTGAEVQIPSKDAVTFKPSKNILHVE